MLSFESIIKTICESFDYIGNKVSKLDSNVSFGQNSNFNVNPKELLLQFYDKETNELIFLEVLINKIKNLFEISSSLYAGESGDILSELLTVQIDENNNNFEKVTNFISSLEKEVLLAIKAFRTPKPENIFNSFEKKFDSIHEKILNINSNINYSGMGIYDKGNIDLLWVLFSLPELKKSLAINIPVKRTGESLKVSINFFDSINRDINILELFPKEIPLDENSKEYKEFLIEAENFLNNSVPIILKNLESV